MNSVTVEQVICTEIDILNVLNWNLQHVVSPLELAIDISLLLDLRVLNLI